MSLYFDNKDAFLEPSVKQYGSHMVMSNVHRSTKHKYINIDTRFTDEFGYSKTSFNTTPSYTITLPERINDVKSIRAVTCEIPVSYYNISSCLGNNTFVIIDNTTDTSQRVSVADGNYTPSSLNTAIYNKVYGFGGNFTKFNIDISNTTLYTNVSSTSGASFTLYFDVDSSGNTAKYNFRSRLGWLLGYRDISSNVGTTATYGVSAVNLNTVRYLYLVVDEYTNSFPNSFLGTQYGYIMNKKILARITVDYQQFPFGTVVFGNEYNGVMISDRRDYQGKIDIQKLNIQLVNEWGVPIDLNGLDFSFTLEVIHE